MTDGREIANFCAHIQQHKPVDTRCVQRLRSVEAKKTRAVNSLSKHRLSPLVRPLTF
jgi:hypothetical protein